MKSLFLALCLAAISLAPVAKAAEGETRFAISAPSMIWDGDAFWGGNISVLHGIGSNLDLGLETGFHTHSESVSLGGIGINANIWVLPILPTIIYHIDAGSSDFAPYVGASVGVGLVHTNINLGGSLGGDDTAMKFEGLAHLGSFFGASKNFFLDLQAGIIDSKFAFLPQIGYMF